MVRGGLSWTILTQGWQMLILTMSFKGKNLFIPEGPVVPFWYTLVYTNIQLIFKNCGKFSLILMGKSSAI